MKTTLYRREMSCCTPRVLLSVAVTLTVLSGALAGLPKCHEEATSLPDGWQEITAPQKDIAFALPPEFTWTASQPSFIHGGGLWTGSGIEVTVTYGHWNLSSFDTDDADRVCRTKINGLPLVLIVKSGEDWHSLTAWIQTKAKIYEPVLGVSFTRWDDMAVARHIIGSVHRVKAK